MATAVIMPKFEMAQESGTVARWLKNEGDAVTKGDALLEVETDKVTMEVEAPASGVLVNVTAPAGLVVPIGQPIAFIAAAGEQVKTAAAQAATQAATPTPAVAANAAGYKITPLAERVASAHGLDVSTVAGTGPQGRVTRDDVEYALAQRSSAGTAPEAPALWPAGKVRAVPAARRLARELQIDLLQIGGSGPQGRIQPGDVLSAAQRREQAAAMAAAPVAAPAPVPVQATTGGPVVRRMVPLTNIRRTIAERMTASVREAPQFSVSLDADMGRAQTMVDDLRAAGAGKDGPKVTLTAFLVKACAWALAQYPAANASFDPSGQIFEWADVNVGVATATDQGLLVPVIHGAGQLGVREIAARLADVTARARDGRLRLEDIQGGTFTVSNLGMFGIDRFTAILNPPQAAILAIGRVTRRPVIGPEDQIKICSMATLTLTADHRVLDGAGAARFLAIIQQVLEHPGILLA